MFSRTSWRFIQSRLTGARQQCKPPQCISCHCRQLLTDLQRVSQAPQARTLVQQPIRRACASLVSSPISRQSKSKFFLPNHSALVEHLRTPLCRRNGQVWSYGGFKTSARHHAIPPLVALLFVKPIAKLTAIFSGRAFRNWWKALPHNKRQYFFQVLRENRYKILGTAAGLTGICGIYYYSHLQVTPITERARFIAVTDSQFKKIAATEYEKMKSLHATDSVHASHPLYLTIAQIVQKITRANSDIPQVRDRTWTIHIIDKDIKNAFALPNGEIFVFAGILKAVANEEQLGTVLAHEMAHVVLNHAAEQISFFEFVDLLLIVVLAAIWAFLPSDGLAVVATWFKGKVVQLLLEMPYSRNLEAEADRVGLVLAAKSCLDVRESKAFWESMALQSEISGDKLDIEWLSTHPTHQNRADTLGSLMPEALELRKLCNCPSLPPTDPSAAIEKQRQILAEERERLKKEPAAISGIRITS